MCVCVWSYMSWASFNINLTFLRYWFINFIHYLSYERRRNRQEYFKHKIVIKYIHNITYIQSYIHTQLIPYYYYNIRCVKGIPKMFLPSKKLNFQILYPCHRTRNSSVFLSLSLRNIEFSLLVCRAICVSHTFVWSFYYKYIPHIVPALQKVLTPALFHDIILTQLI